MSYHKCMCIRTCMHVRCTCIVLLITTCMYIPEIFNRYDLKYFQTGFSYYSEYFPNLKCLAKKQKFSDDLRMLVVNFAW